VVGSDANVQFRPAKQKSRMTRGLLFVWLCLALAQPAFAQADRPAGSPVSVAIDLRGRFESDVDSRREDGTMRDDRHRGRMRGRLEMRARPSRSLLVVGRVRTGSPFSQQSPHLTIVDFSGGAADRVTAVADRFLVQHTTGRFESWIGRNEFPFWSQNEFFWDRGVTVPGGFVSYRTSLRNPSLQVRAGYFGLPDGAVDVRGRMAAGQVVLAGRLSRLWSLQGAAGLFALDGAARTRYLLTGNGHRDYRIGVGSAQLTRVLDHDWFGMLRIGADVLRNFQSYPSSEADPLAAAHGHARTGIVLMTAIGGHAKPGEPRAWEISHTFAHIEKLAVNASYAQDDWVRWGSATQTDSSNLKGHEAGGRYWFSSTLDCQARAFFVRSITTPQNGARVRLDVNWRFLR
jgi:hypothetical protein